MMRLHLSARVMGLAAMAALLGACIGDIGDHHPESEGGETSGGSGDSTGPGGGTEGFTDITTLSAEQTQQYLGKLAPPFVGRVLSAKEQASVADKGGAAIEPILLGWTEEPAFAKAARALIEQRLSTSGTKEGVDMNLPGNLAEHVVAHDLPWSQLLTSESCYDAEDQVIECDSGAPYTAGVLTTRGYLMSRASRFNLTRSSTMMRGFLCVGYPQDDEVQPRIDKERLIPMFRALTPEEQTVEEAKSGFGNGSGCYTCHGQFSLHAQMFVKFDAKGLWQDAADGIQDPEGELGRSLNGLMASHLDNPDEARLETSQFLGQEVANLSEAAKVLTKHPLFLGCAARNALDYGLMLDTSVDIHPELLARIGAAASASDSDPTFGSIFVATFIDPDIVRATVLSLTGEEP
ncbi:MAG: hypothetical protein WKG00_29500 [Polyangiaceae bacterium]